MKKLFAISISALLILGLAACGSTPPPTSSAPSISVEPSPPPVSESESGSSNSLPEAPPIPADAAMYRGTITNVTQEGDNHIVTLEQAEGTDFGAPSLKFAFTKDTYAGFTPEVGQYLEVYYGRAPGQPLDVAATHNIITAIKYQEAGMVNFNGTLKSVEAHPEKPGQGWLVVESLSAEGMQGEIRFNYGSEDTQFYLNFDELKPGDKLNIFHPGVFTMSLPPQGSALEVRKYVEPAAK
ncbi:MAG: hypothetical protein RR528_02675 [Angelakisella sp.]